MRNDEIVLRTRQRDRRSFSLSKPGMTITLTGMENGRTALRMRGVENKLGTSEEK